MEVISLGFRRDCRRHGVHFKGQSAFSTKLSILPHIYLWAFLIATATLIMHVQVCSAALGVGPMSRIVLTYGWGRWRHGFFAATPWCTGLRRICGSLLRL